tara:strand:+ start:539 stop:1204 length:666 start_codon:yes stop_codon:yes gene_type:complete
MSNNIINTIMDVFKKEDKNLLPSDKERTLPSSWVEATTSEETHEQTGGEFKMDEGMINVFTDKLKVVEFNEDITEVTNIVGIEALEAQGESSGGIIDSFIEKYYNKGDSGATEIQLEGRTADGQSYDFTLVADSRDDKGNQYKDGKPKFFIYSGNRKAELEMDQFVKIANNLDEKLASVENVRQTQDRWSPKSFRYAWEQKPKITVGEPYPSLGNRPKQKG